MRVHPNALSSHSSLLVLKDGRTNYRDPAINFLSYIVTDNQHAHWLNFEPKHLWGSGAQRCHATKRLIDMHERCSAKLLAAAINQLLPV